MKKIVIDDAVPYAKAIFSHLGEVICLPGKAITRQDIMDADALIIRSRTQINSTLLQGTNVRFIGSTVVGLDHVDQDYLQQQGIHFYSAQGCNANSVAEFVITQMVMMAEEHHFNLSEKSLAIIGVGNVGKRLQKKAAALGMQITLNDPPRQEQEGSANFDDLETALQADIISVHTPLTQTGKHPTHHLLSAARLQTVNAEQIIINAARGGIIDEASWADTNTFINLIDCWENEPNMNQALYQTARMATPHIAGHSLDAKINGSEMAYHALCQFWNTSPQTTWRENLPLPPSPILAKGDTLQSILHSVLTQSHNPEDDDRAIRSKDIKESIQKFEHYRRNYPIYREWQHQTIFSTPNTEANNLLQKLGFNVIT